MRVAVKDFLMEFGIDFHCVLFHESGSGCIVTFALYALHFGKKISAEVAKFLVVIDFNECLAVALYEFDYVFGLSLSSTHLAMS